MESEEQEAEERTGEFSGLHPISLANVPSFPFLPSVSSPASATPLVTSSPPHTSDLTLYA